MEAYDNLRAVIAANVYQNNNNEVTADMVKTAMNEMVNSLGAEFQFGGEAKPSDPGPGTPDYKVAYLAATPGTYSNFGGIVVNPGEVAIIKGSGSTWSKDVTGSAEFASIFKRVQQCVTTVQNGNLFDKEDPGIITGKYITNSGYADYSHAIISHPILLMAGIQYKWPHATALGGNDNIAKVDTNGAYIGNATGTITNGYMLFTPAESAFYRVNLFDSVLADFMVFAAADYPTEFVPFNLAIAPRFGLSAKQLSQVNEIFAGVLHLEDYFVESKSVNLFNKHDALIKNGYYGGSDAEWHAAATYRVSGPISVKAGVSYTMIYNADSLGQANNNVVIVNASNEKIGAFTGTINDAKTRLTFVPAADMLISINVGGTAKLDTMMLCKTSEFPENYTPFYHYVTLTGVQVPEDSVASKLTGKSVIFAGDSICAGAEDSYGGGYARRIGERNNMVWQNLAIGGATIIDDALVGSSASISETDFGAGADFIILEGGTNDADRIGSIIGGSTPELFGAFSTSGYQDDFTNQTFCGAVEFLIKHIVTDFPEAKVGFIIAPKMGVSNNYTKTGNNRRAYFETIIEICHKWGVPVLNLWDECTMNPRIASHYTSGEDYLYADGQHPTANGYDFLTPIIEAWMLTL